MSCGTSSATKQAADSLSAAAKGNAVVSDGERAEVRCRVDIGGHLQILAATIPAHLGGVDIFVLAILCASERAQVADR